MATTEPIQIPIEAIDNATRVVENFGKNVAASTQSVTTANKGASLSFTDLYSVVGLVGKVYSSVSGVVKEAYGSFSKAAEATRDLALASGTTATEASTLLQVLDDYQISAEDVTAASKKMKENGLVPTLETLAKLSDQFLAIQDPAERLQFAQDNLGRSYSKYLNVLQQGGDVLRKNAQDVNKNLVLSDKQVASYEKQRLAIDEFSDAWEGLKVQAGSFVGEIIIEWKEQKDTENAVAEYAKQQGIVIRNQHDAAKVTEIVRNQMMAEAAATAQASSQTMMLSHTMREYGMSGKEAAEAQEEMAQTSEDAQKANAQSIESMIALQEETDKYNQSQSEILAKISELEAKKAAMYPWEKSAIAEVNGEIEEQKEKYAAGVAAFEEAQGKKLAMMALEKIALSDGVAGYNAAELAKAQAILNTAGVAEDSAIRQTLAFEQASSAIASSAEPAKDLQRILDMMKQGYSIDVAINYIENGKPPVVPGAAGATSGPNAQAQAGGYGYAASGAGNTPRARGGPLSRGGWTLVGDMAGGRLTPYSELISPEGYVYDAKTTRWLIRSGIVGGFDSRANAGDLDGGGGGGIYKPPPSLPSPTKAPKKGNGGSGSGGLLSVALSGGGDATGVAGVAVALEQQAQQSQSVAMQIQASVIAAVAQAMGTNTDELRAIRDLLKGQPREIGKTVAYEVVKAVM